MSGVPNANQHGPSLAHTNERYRELVRLVTRMAEIERRLEEIEDITNRHWYSLAAELTSNRRPGYKPPTKRQYICPCCHEIVVLQIAPKVHLLPPTVP